MCGTGKSLEAATNIFRLRGDRETTPLAVNRHYLMNPAVVSVQKIASVGDSLSMG